MQRNAELFLLPVFLHHCHKDIQLLHRVLGTLDAMSHRQIALVDLVVVAALGRLVPEEVYLVVSLNVTQTIGLVPTDGKDVEGNLSTLKNRFYIDIIFFPLKLL